MGAHAQTLSSLVLWTYSVSQLTKKSVEFYKGPFKEFASSSWGISLVSSSRGRKSVLAVEQEFILINLGIWDEKGFPKKVFDTLVLKRTFQNENSCIALTQSQSYPKEQMFKLGLASVDRCLLTVMIHNWLWLIIQLSSLSQNSYKTLKWALNFNLKKEEN